MRTAFLLLIGWFFYPYVYAYFFLMAYTVPEDALLQPVISQQMSFFDIESFEVKDTFANTTDFAGLNFSIPKLHKDLKITDKEIFENDTVQNAHYTLTTPDRTNNFRIVKSSITDEKWSVICESFGFSLSCPEGTINGYELYLNSEKITKREVLLSTRSTINKKLLYWANYISMWQYESKTYQYETESIKGFVKFRNSVATFDIYIKKDPSVMYTVIYTISPTDKQESVEIMDTMIKNFLPTVTVLN